MVMEDKEAEAARAQKVLTKIAEREHASTLRAVRDLCQSPQGRDFLWYLLRIGRVGMQPFSGENRSQTDFNCGELNVGQQILALIIEAEPSGYLRILEDQQNAERERNSALREQDVPEPGSE